MRMYIKKDVAQQIWKYGALPTQQTAKTDPYQGKTITLAADQMVDSLAIALPMNAPRSLAFACRMVPSMLLIRATIVFYTLARMGDSLDNGVNPQEMT